ncbi:MAG: hypothetical protein H0W09_00260 [Solirubrobacterales bacterium]|nr:hypothetical protein [Solirubrobacterales bacterium]
MPRLIRLDRSGHSELARWEAGDRSGHDAAAALLTDELDRGMIASANRGDGTAEVIRELPVDAELIVLRRPIVGG